MIVYTDEGACESEYLSEGDEDGMVDFAQWRAAEARYKQYPTKPAQTYC